MRDGLAFGRSRLAEPQNSIKIPCELPPSAICCFAASTTRSRKMAERPRYFRRSSRSRLKADLVVANLEYPLTPGGPSRAHKR